MEHILSPIQEDFIKKAIDLRAYVIQFDVSDEEFNFSYGCSKDEMQEELKDLKKLMS